MNDEVLQRGLKNLDRGNFTRLDELLRENNLTIFDVLAAAEDQKEYLDEAFAWACMIGRVDDAEKLLDLGADPEAGSKTGLTGAHYAASGGHETAIELIIRRGVPLETVNMYGGTVLGQAVWSARNESKPSHPRIIEVLVSAGATVDEFMINYWKGQDISDKAYKARILSALQSGRAR